MGLTQFGLTTAKPAGKILHLHLLLSQLVLEALHHLGGLIGFFLKSNDVALSLSQGLFGLDSHLRLSLPLGLGMVQAGFQFDDFPVLDTQQVSLLVILSENILAVFL